MKLKTSLFLATGLAVLVVLGFSEWLSYLQMAAFLRDHAALMEAEMNHADLAANLRHGREMLFTRLALLHMLHAGVTVLALVIVLNTLCNRIVLAPLQDLLRHINYMRHGAWKASIAVRRKDEIGQLTQAFNELGEELTLTVQQFASASKLAAMALLGQALVKRVMEARDSLRASERLLGAARNHHEAVPEQALTSLEAAIKTLEDIPLRFDEDFNRQFGLHAASPAPKSSRMPQD
jgi:methyl-accepting chemotaxis protein